MSFLTLAGQFLVIVLKGLWSWFSNKDISDKTNTEVQDILKAQRDGQITTPAEADQWQDAHQKEF